MATKKMNWINPLEAEVEYYCDHGGQEKRIPDVVVKSILKKFRQGDSFDTKEFDRVMAELSYSRLEGCYFFTWAGMVCGVEENDGYIHT